MSPLAIHQKTLQWNTVIHHQGLNTCNHSWNVYETCIVPGELSPAAANPERLRRERTCDKNSIFLFLQILDFEKIREKVEKQQDEWELLSQRNGWKISNERNGVLN